MRTHALAPPLNHRSPPHHQPPTTAAAGTARPHPLPCPVTFGQQNSEEEAFEIMDYAMARGDNWLDTAEL